MSPGLLVVAKAPVPGRAKTRIAGSLGDVAAADLAAAAFLDTLDVGERWAPEGRRLIALTGELRDGMRAAELSARLSGWTVVRQRGDDFAHRLVHAHHDADSEWGPDEAVVQIATDTPQLTVEDLDSLVAALQTYRTSPVDAVLGPADDGGWWGLVTRRAGYVDGLRDVPMSTPYTYAHTAAMLVRAGARMRRGPTLCDVDTLADARRVAAAAPTTRFAAALADLSLRSA